MEDLLPHLRQEVLDKFGKTLEVKNEVNELADDIWKVTHQQVSNFTIRRFFSRIKYEGTFSVSTLTIFARYVGYKGWEDYLQHKDVNSGFLSNKHILVSNLHGGEKFRLRWQPNRICELEYMPLGKMRVMHTENSHLQTGDILELNEIADGLPLVVNHVWRNGEDKGAYVAGEQTGITWEQI